VQGLMFGLVERPGVASSTDCQFDPAEVLDVGALVEFAGVTGGGVSDQEPDRAALLDSESIGPDLVDDQTLIADGVERDRDMEVVAVGMEREVGGSRPRRRQAQQRLQGHRISPSTRLETRDVADLRVFVHRDQVFVREREGPFDFPLKPQ
jgi:hypothetical protein